MPRKKKVREIMVPLGDYPHLPYWFTLKQAITLLRLSDLDREHYGRPPRVVLVFGDSGELVGLLRKRDVLRGLEPDHLGRSPRPADWPSLSHQAQCALWSDARASRAAAEAPVRDFAIPVKRTIDADDVITWAACLMLQEEVPVLGVTEGGKVAGIVAIEDVFDALTEAVLAPDA